MATRKTKRGGSMAVKAGYTKNKRRYSCGGKLYKCGGKLKSK
jgi:hypothetical protein